MKLEVGKRYKDRSNNVFTIISDQARLPYCYVGEGANVIDRFLEGFTHDGKASLSTFDLVEEVRELQKFETIRYTVTDNYDKYASSGANVANMVGYSTAKRVHPEQVKVKITIEEVEE